MIEGSDENEITLKMAQRAGGSREEMLLRNLQIIKRLACFSLRPITWNRDI